MGLTSKVVSGKMVMTMIVVVLTMKLVKFKNGVSGMALINRLKEYRARIGINQGDLGKKAGVSRQTISLIERGDYSPSVTLALKLAKIFEVQVEDIFEYVERGES